MNNSKYAIRLILNLNTKLFINVTEDISEETALKRLNEDSNNMIFIAAHLLDARYHMANMIGFNTVFSFKDVFDQVTNIKDYSKLPKLVDIRSDWMEFSPKLSAHFEIFNEERLSKKSPFNFPVEDITILGGITFLVSHESYHIGQLGFLRKCFGLLSMKYS